jgi:DNA-binding winged helix-turn-helix (wHTH) protein
LKYSFGGIRVDADARTVTNAGAPLHLTRKAFDLLLLLLERRPDVVTKEQIYARLWPDTFVAESSLQTLAHEIRHAIDDRTARQSWIRTVHGIGYGFSGDVLISEAPASRPPFARPAAWLLGDSKRVPLFEGANVLGRGAEEVIEIDLPTISRRHARITIGDAATIEDLGSKNGTWIGDERLTGPRTLTDGENVVFGSERFTFRVARTSKSTESSEALRPDMSRVERQES